MSETPFTQENQTPSVHNAGQVTVGEINTGARTYYEELYNLSEMAFVKNNDINAAVVGPSFFGIV